MSIMLLNGPISSDVTGQEDQSIRIDPGLILESKETMIHFYLDHCFSAVKACVF